MMVVQYLHTEDAIGNTCDADDDVLSIHILKMQMVMVQYSHTEDADEDDPIFTYVKYRRWFKR